MLSKWDHLQFFFEQSQFLVLKILHKLIIIMKAAMVLAFLGLVACTYAGFVGLGYHAVPAAVVHAPLAIPYAYSTHTYSGLGHNYKLTLDTSLPGSAYASYPYAAAPTAYGYGVIKAL